MEPDVQLSPRVLLAVGDAQLRRNASATLRMRGYSVCATTEEEAALTLARSFSPDVVMVDLTLHSPEGGTLFDTMRTLTDAYIVAIASPDADGDRIRALRAGADDVVASDLDTEEMAGAGIAPGDRVTRAWLLEEVWGPNWVGDTHVVDVHLSNLRRKLQQRAPELRFVHTVRGVGFRLSNDLLRAGDADQRQRRDDDRMLASA